MALEIGAIERSRAGDSQACYFFLLNSYDSFAQVRSYWKNQRFPHACFTEIKDMCDLVSIEPRADAKIDHEPRADAILGTVNAKNRMYGHQLVHE